MDEQALGPRLRLCPVANATVLSLRHRADNDEWLAHALQRAGLPWPDEQALARLSPGGWMVRLSPRHSLAVGRDATVFAAAIQRLAPGRHPGVMAIDTSEGYCVLELRGSGIEPLMMRVMDADPASANGHVVGVARVADVPVIVVPQDALAWCLVVERPLAEHLSLRLRAATQVTDEEPQRG